MHDVAIRGGEVVDGTGAPRRRADVGIRDGRIATIGDVGDARQTIDAGGRVIAPGFVDVHTHIDAQAFWDPYLTPSSLHGVTTMLAGNCGFTLQPLAADEADYLVRMLAVVEGMPLEALRAGVPCDWRTTAEYLDRLDGTLAVNAGFMVGHSALRRLVMGADASERPSTPYELDEMTQLLRDGLAAGALGFSSSWGAVHFDGDGAPVPSRAADPAELVALASICGEYEGTSIEFIPTRVDHFDDAVLQLLTGMTAGARRPLNWNVLRIGAGNGSEVDDVLRAADVARDSGGKIVALVMPIPSRARFSFKTGFVLDALPEWGSVMALPLDERVRALREPEVRRRLANGARQAVGGLAEIAQFDRRVISQTFTDSARRYQGRSVAEIAATEGKEPLDALLDVVCADELMTNFTRIPSEPSRADWDAIIEACRSGRVIFGGSDAGAHLDFTASFDYPTYILEKAVRAQQALELEEAVHLLTEVPARLYGLVDRGRVAVGQRADLVVFDPATIASGELQLRADLPGGADRLYAEPVGVDHVLVNGVPIVERGALTGARPGTLLRSGRDTRDPDLTR